jgi:hypothetical protein
LRPFVTVRLPTLAWATATLGPIMMQIAVIILIAAVVFYWFQVFWQDLAFDPAARATVLLTVSSVSLGAPAMITLHECRAALFIALSIAVWKPNRFAVSIVLELLVVLFRDLALPYLFLMAFGAACENR